MCMCMRVCMHLCVCVCVCVCVHTFVYACAHVSLEYVKILYIAVVMHLTNILSLASFDNHLVWQVNQRHSRNTLLK